MVVHQVAVAVCMHGSTFVLPSLPAVAYQHLSELEYLYASHLHHVETAGHIEVMHMLGADDLSF